MKYAAEGSPALNSSQRHFTRGWNETPYQAQVEASCEDYVSFRALNDPCREATMGGRNGSFMSQLRGATA